MKKLFFVLIAVCMAGAVNAQELTNKKGTPILPKAGDWGLGIDATPLFNVLKFNNNAEPAFSSASFYGKYFLNNKTALRGRVRLGFQNLTEITPVDKDGGAAGEQVDDKEIIKNLDILLGFGIEKRIGSTRLQGIYGVEGNLGFGLNNSRKYTYGNEMTSTSVPSTRPTAQNAGFGFQVGVYVFGGVEYFVAPGISLGGELSWGIEYQSEGKGEETVEYYSGGVKTRTEKTPGTSRFGFAKNLRGGINMCFYF